MRYKVPALLRILGHNVKVEITEGLMENHNALGIASANSNTILLDPKQDASQLLDTLIHEINHFISYINNLDVASDEEGIVTRMSSGMAAVLIDNPELGKLYGRLVRDLNKELEEDRL